MKKTVLYAVLVFMFFQVFPASPAPEEVVYYLPLKYGDSRRVFQGNNGKTSHNDSWNRYAFDFSMPVGTPVVASADGVVTFVKEDTAGPTGNGADNNKVAILHADGNVSEYQHIKQDGAVVEKDQKVLRGDLIAYSGNTGYSSAPHLHFGLVAGNHLTGTSVPCKFADIGGDGVPKTGDTVTSKNFPVRDMVEYKQIEKAAALYGLCADLGCLEAAVKELKALEKIKFSKQYEIPKSVFRRRDDLLAEYEKAAEDALETMKKADADDDMKTAVRLAFFGEKDFRESEKGADIRSFHAELKKKEEYKEAAESLKAERDYRKKVSKAIRSEMKTDAKIEKGSKASYKSVIKSYRQALAVAPEGKVLESLKKHIEELEARDE
ncbi:MAG: M23 family metallopeptidase [Planctomycetota bacterium]|jgi:hypothetical protein